jgi:hypothetical protein
VIRYDLFGRLSPLLWAHISLFLLVFVCNVGIGVLTFGDQLAAKVEEVSMEVIGKIGWFGVLSTIVTEAGAATAG